MHYGLVYFIVFHQMLSLVAGAAVYIVVKENFPSKFNRYRVNFEEAKNILETILKLNGRAKGT